jgi:hypothetical protein
MYQYEIKYFFKLTLDVPVMRRLLMGQRPEVVGKFQLLMPMVKHS